MGVRNFALYTFFLFFCDLIHFQRLANRFFETIFKSLNLCNEIFFSPFPIAKLFKIVISLSAYCALKCSLRILTIGVLVA
jgi:hypothetical protein